MSDEASAELHRAVTTALASPTDDSIHHMRLVVRDTVERRRRSGIHVRATIAELDEIGESYHPPAPHRASVIAEAVTAAIAAYYGLR